MRNGPKISLVYASLLFLILPAAHAQLYLIAGTPTPTTDESFAAMLLRVDGESISIEEELATKEEGLWWIEPFYEGRKLAFMTRESNPVVKIVSFDEARVVKTCIGPHATADEFVSGTRLLNIPGRGISVVRKISGVVSGTITRALDLNPQKSCEESNFEVLPVDAKTVVFNGKAGVGPVGSLESLGLWVDNRGEIHSRVGENRILWDYVVPRTILGPSDQMGGVVLINNESVLVISLAGPGRFRTGSLVSYRKRDQKWQRLPFPGGIISDTRAFGPFIAMSESRESSESLSKNAGETAMRADETQAGPSIRFRLKLHSEKDRVVYPGRLHIYDTNTEKSYTIPTNQADSEVLLVDSQTVYYRVNDELYSCTITSSGLTPSKLLVKSDLIGDVHWAFLR